MSLYCPGENNRRKKDGFDARLLLISPVHTHPDFLREKECFMGHRPRAALISLNPTRSGRSRR